MKKCLLMLAVCQLMVVSLFGQNIGKLTGKVADTGNKPISSATVHVLNTSRYQLTNDQGVFSFDNLANGAYTLEVSSAGFATLVQDVTIDGNNQPLTISMQPVSVQLEAVTVTADKRETILQKQPSSVTAITARQVQDYRLWNAKEISGIVPGLYSGNSGDERNVTSIRGITTTSYDPAVATYIDGVNQFSLDTYIPQLNDIERIEVLRGPQGTLYGRNAMGGVINIITKQPTNGTTGFAEVSLGNYNQQRYSAGVKTALVKNKLFFGAAGLYSSRDGFYTNEFNNKSFDDQSGFTGNYYLKYLPSSSWSITLNAKHQNSRNNGVFAMAFGTEEAFKNPFKLTQNALSKMEDNTFNGSLSVHHNGNKVDFTSQTSFQNNRRIYKSPVDGDFSPLDAIGVVNDYGGKWNNVKVFTQELRFNSALNNNAKLNWTAGAYFFHQYNPNKQGTHFGEDAKLIYPDLPGTNFATINVSEAKNSGIAFFGQLNYAITQKLQLFGGLRYDYERKKLAVRGEYQPDGGDAFTTLPDTAASANFSALSPKIGLQYQLAKNSSAFVSYSRGFRTGGLTQLSSDPNQPPLFPYNPEYSNNIEAGIKNNLLNNRLRINASVFVTYVTNAQVPTLVLPDAITITRNTGSLSSKGVELELVGKPARGLQVEYSAGYTDAHYKSLKVSSNGSNANLDGKKQIFTPDVTSMLALQYGYTISEKHHLQVVARGEWFYFGERYFDLANTIRQAPNSLLNTRIGITCNKLELFFWGRNLSNEHYIEYAYDFGGIHLGNPRTYGVTLRANF